MNMKLTAFFLLLALTTASASYRPGLLLREDWKETPPETPVTQDHVANPELVLTLHGPGKNGIKKSNHDKPEDDPFYIWSGMCEGNWMLSLSPKDYLMDLTGHAKIRWRSKQSGFRQLRIVIQLDDESWLVSDQYDDQSRDWRIREFNVRDINWYALNVEDIRETKAIDQPDLSKVRSIGFTDLMAGGKSSACSRLDWIEVYAIKAP